MHIAFLQSGKTDICLWCDGACKVTPSRKFKQPNDDCPTASKRAEKESEVDITINLKSLHGDKYTEPQFRLWAKMIINGLHSSRHFPPNI